jgi:hypothetical protein
MMCGNLHSDRVTGYQIGLELLFAKFVHSVNASKELQHLDVAPKDSREHTDRTLLLHTMAIGLSGVSSTRRMSQLTELAESVARDD